MIGFYLILALSRGMAWYAHSMCPITCSCMGGLHLHLGSLGTRRYAQSSSGACGCSCMGGLYLILALLIGGRVTQRVSFCCRCSGAGAVPGGGRGLRGQAARSGQPRRGLLRGVPRQGQRGAGLQRPRGARGGRHRPALRHAARPQGARALCPVMKPCPQRSCTAVPHDAGSSRVTGPYVFTSKTFCTERLYGANCGHAALLHVADKKKHIDSQQGQHPDLNWGMGGFAVRCLPCHSACNRGRS